MSKHVRSSNSTHYRGFARMTWLALFITDLALIFILFFASIRLTDITHDIARNAAPSVVELAAANLSLGELEHLMEDHIDGIGDQVLLPAQLQTAQKALRDAVDRYLNLPNFPGERELGAHLQSDLANIERIAGQVQQFPPNPPNRIQLLAQFRQASTAMRDELNEVSRFNVALLLDDERHIDQVRRVTLPLAVVINVGGLVVASASMLIALRLVRNFTASEALARVELERRADELDTFSAQVAHDLLSPLMTTNLALAVARDKLPADDHKTRVQLARAEASLGHVRALVDGLLEFARADINPAVPMTADLGQVMAEVAASFSALGERDDIDFVIEPFESLGVAAYPGVVGSMVSNLLQNAFRAVGKRDVRRVIVRVNEEGTRDKPMVRIAVEDTGGGVDPDIEPLLFQPHAHNARGQASPGLGLGLATVRRLAVRHGGTVGFSSKRGVGSTFWFTLPCAKPWPS